MQSMYQFLILIFLVELSFLIIYVLNINIILVDLFIVYKIIEVINWFAVMDWNLVPTPQVRCFYTNSPTPR